MGHVREDELRIPRPKLALLLNVMYHIRMQPDAARRRGDAEESEHSVVDRANNL
jgi:hypothetical protein